MANSNQIFLHTQNIIIAYNGTTGDLVTYFNWLKYKEMADNPKIITLKIKK